MTREEEMDLKLLRFANEKGKFVIALGLVPQSTDELQYAFERGIEGRWFTLVDVSPIETDQMNRLYRIFVLTEAGHARRDMLAAQEHLEQMKGGTHAH